MCIPLLVTARNFNEIAAFLNNYFGLINKTRGKLRNITSYLYVGNNIYKIVSQLTHTSNTQNHRNNPSF